MILKKTANKIFIFMAIAMISSVPLLKADAPANNQIFSNEELTKRFLNLQLEVRNLRGTVQEQNKIIKALSSKVDEREEGAVAIPSPVSSETKKPKTLKENLKHYLLEKPESLPKDTEKLPVKAGMGSVEVGALLQEWYTWDEHAKDNFRHRRLELGLSGKLIEHLKWKLQIDPALTREDNTTRSILKDAYFAFDRIPHHVVKLGQYKVPVTEEGFRSSALIDTIERSFIGRTFGDKRDIGLMTEGKWKYLDYQVGVFNGDEANRFDTNEQKDVAARFVLKPFPDHVYLKGLEGGSNLYFRTTHDTASEKKRIGLEGRYLFGPLSLKAEYMKAQDVAVPAYGWYAQAGYRFLPRWETVFRFEGFDPDERISENKEFDTIIGLNYYLVADKIKLQFNYVHKDAEKNGTTDNQIIAAVQYAL